MLMWPNEGSGLDSNSTMTAALIEFDVDENEESGSPPPVNVIMEKPAAVTAALLSKGSVESWHYSCAQNVTHGSALGCFCWVWAVSDGQKIDHYTQSISMLYGVEFYYASL